MAKRKRSKVTAAIPVVRRVEAEFRDMKPNSPRWFFVTVAVCLQRPKGRAPAAGDALRLVDEAVGSWEPRERSKLRGLRLFDSRAEAVSGPA